MSEPTIEEMKRAVLAVYDDAEECVYQKFGVPMRAIVAEVILAEQQVEDAPPRDLWIDAYSKLPAKAAPENEDEARNSFWKWAKLYHAEWFNAFGNVCYDKEIQADNAWYAWKAAWNARARLLTAFVIALIVGSVSGCAGLPVAKPMFGYSDRDIEMHKVGASTFFQWEPGGRLCADVGQWWHGNGEQWQSTVYNSGRPIQTWTADEHGALLIAYQSCPVNLDAGRKP